MYAVILPAPARTYPFKSRQPNQKKKVFCTNNEMIDREGEKENENEENKTMKMIKKTLTETMRWNGDNAFKWGEREREGQEKN